MKNPLPTKLKVDFKLLVHVFLQYTTVTATISTTERVENHFMTNL